ncbi:hypothetical protein Rsub_13142 [Raphidocelis subcapitata]|uniref:Pherophorin domain-containing protein n=1 Tax=Raphidocelis subcapitata TaxID=307507 RepID=A0A2V0PRM0_9CHLO|nr:hypothetical protein Rsub_13142 [Raphidocelis subcapitata]|eukprot:GBG00228.1 hypothetical protein Rsub_13142 [Raphidocelis subcapitata]
MARTQFTALLLVVLACLMVAAAGAVSDGRMLLAAPVCGTTVPEGAVNASSFTMAFDGATGCFKIGVNADCDPAKGGHCCVGGSAPRPPKFNYVLIKPSAGSTCATKFELKNIKLKVGGKPKKLVLVGADIKVKLATLSSSGGEACFDFSKASAACKDVSKLCGAGGCGAQLVTKRFSKAKGEKRNTCCLGGKLSGGLCGAAPPKADGTACSIGSCQAGVCKDMCIGITCPAPGECQSAAAVPVLQLVGKTVDDFFDPAEPLTWQVKNAVLDPATVEITVDGSAVDPASITADASQIAADLGGFGGGGRLVVVNATGTASEDLDWSAVLWLGTRELVVHNYAVSASLTEVTLKLENMPAPSPIANNDLMNGTAGWDTAVPDALTIQNHVENITAVDSGLSGVMMPPAAGSRDPEAMLQQRQEWRRPEAKGLVIMPVAQAGATDYADYDLVITTTGQGPVSVSHTFEVPSGSGQVEIRYRFVTNEYPTWYGSEYDDTFSVVVKSLKKGVVFSEGGSLNGLPASAYTITMEGASTEWWKKKVAVDPDGDTVQVILSVANVGDGLVDSSLYLDYVTAGRVCIRPLKFTWFTDVIVHCYIDGVTKTTQYDKDGVGPELYTNAYLHSCREITGASAEGVLQAAKAAEPFYLACPASESWTQMWCEAPKYNIMDHNCCHFVDAAIKAAGSPTVTSYFPGYDLYPDVAEPPPPTP